MQSAGTEYLIPVEKILANQSHYSFVGYSCKQVTHRYGEDFILSKLLCEVIDEEIEVEYAKLNDLQKICIDWFDFMIEYEYAKFLVPINLQFLYSADNDFAESEIEFLLQEIINLLDRPASEKLSMLDKCIDGDGMMVLIFQKLLRNIREYPIEESNLNAALANFSREDKKCIFFKNNFGNYKNDWGW